MAGHSCHYVAIAGHICWLAAFWGGRIRRLSAVAGIEQPWPEPLPRDVVLGFSIPLSSSVVRPAPSRPLIGCLIPDDRLPGTTPLFRDHSIACRHWKYWTTMIFAVFAEVFPAHTSTEPTVHLRPNTGSVFWESSNRCTATAPCLPTPYHSSAPTTLRNGSRARIFTPNGLGLPWTSTQACTPAHRIIVIKFMLWSRVCSNQNPVRSFTHDCGVDETRDICANSPPHVGFPETSW